MTMAAVQDLHPPHRAPDGFAADEWAVRCDIAAAYRLCALYGWTDLDNTHISARVPGTVDEFLLNPFGLFFEEITASSLMRVGPTRYGSCSRHAPRCSPKSWASSTGRFPRSSSAAPDCAWAPVRAPAPSPSSNDSPPR